MILKSLLSCFLWTSAALAQDRLSVHPSSSALAKPYLPSASSKLTQSQIHSVLKEIGESDRIQSARADLSGGKVLFVVEEVKQQQKLLVNGNQALTEAEIFSILGADKTPQLSMDQLQRLLPRLKEKYESIGLRNVDIQLRENTQSETTEFTIDVNEGRSASLEDVVVLSQDQTLNSSVRYALSRFRGKPIDKAVMKDIERTINDILIDDRKLGAKITKITPIYNQDRSSAKVTVTIETAFSYEFVFDGNAYFSPGNIISHFDLEKNYLNYIKNSNLLIKDVESLYRENGFANVTVTTENVQYEKLRKIVILFRIKEGPQMRIKNITVTGKITRAPSFYEQMIYNNLNEMNNTTIFVKQNMDRAIEKVAITLKDEGYLKAETTALNYVFNDDSTVSIHVQINENMLTQVRNIQFVGIKNFTSSQLHDVIDLKPNSTLNLVKVYESFLKLRTFYQKNGYLEFKIATAPENLVRFLDNYEFADLKYEIVEGPQIVIKDIQVRGNTFTKSKVILREIDLKPGSVLTSDLINDSIIFLERTQLFARAQIQTSDANSDVSERTIFVDIVEKNPGLFSSGIGVSNDRDITLRGNAGISYNNIRGSGRGASVRGDLRYSLNDDVQYPENRVVLGYYEPFLFFNRLRARVNLIREQLIIFADPNSTDVTIQTNNEFSWYLEKQWTRRLKLLWNTYSLSGIRTFNKSDGATRESIEVATIGPGFEWDRRNDTFVPNDGTFTMAQAEYSNPIIGSSNDATRHIDFFRITAGHTVYTPLTENKRWVLVNDFRWGYLDNLSNKANSGVPFNKLFYLGGRATLRGYDLRREERVPSLTEVCAKTGIACESIDDFFVKTSSNYYLIKTELRFPLRKELGGVLFYDGGAVFIKGVDIKDHYRDTAGFGIRYITPIGALSAELGFKLDRKSATPFLYREDERPYVFHISIGSY